MVIPGTKGGAAETPTYAAYLAPSDLQAGMRRPFVMGVLDLLCDALGGVAATSTL